MIRGSLIENKSIWSTQSVKHPHESKYDFISPHLNLISLWRTLINDMSCLSSQQLGCNRSTQPQSDSTSHCWFDTLRRRNCLWTSTLSSSHWSGRLNACTKWVSKFLTTLNLWSTWNPLWRRIVMLSRWVGLIHCFSLFPSLFVSLSFSPWGGGGGFEIWRERILNGGEKKGADSGVCIEKDEPGLISL